MHPIRQDVESLLLRGHCSGNSRLQGMCQELYDHREWLWTFLEVEGIEPTNNASERALRHAVIWPSSRSARRAPVEVGSWKRS